VRVSKVDDALDHGVAVAKVHFQKRFILIG